MQIARFLKAHWLKILVAVMIAVSSAAAFAQSDRDGDGIPDSSDACPNRGNEGGLGTDESGCPYYDNDWDGVYNRNDACVNRGDEYGFGIGADGCPLTSAPATDAPGDNPSDNPGGDNPGPEQTDVPEATPEVTPEATEDPFGSFDGVRDADGDGFPDDEDACPWRGNEGGLGTDETGCPYYDTDWDGFYDRDDACPWRGNEGGLGVDETGCPYYDADWDGVYDRDDECPWRANEYGFGVDADGCPLETDPETTPDPEATIDPEATPDVTPDMTPDVTPDVTPEVTPEVTETPTPEVTPEVTEEPEVTDLTIEITDGSGQGGCETVDQVVVCTLTINFTVTNAGNTDVGAFDVLIDGAPMGNETVNVPGLAAGATYDGSVELGPVAAWCYDPDCEMTATVDSGDVVAEDDETNNVDTLLILG